MIDSFCRKVKQAMQISPVMVNWLIGAGVLFPLFFQLSGGIYRDFVTDSGGNIATLPLPISMVVCFIGIAISLRNFRHAALGFGFLAAIGVCMVLSVIFASEDHRVELRKLVLMAQFLLPMFALVLGMLVRDDEKHIPKAFFAVLVAIVPFQLCAGWMQGTMTLTNDLYLFSIYQHFQFVPLIFICAFAYSAAALWATHRLSLLLFAPVMLLYSLASVSYLSILMYVSFVILFAAQKLRSGTRMWGSRAAVILVSAIAISVVVGFGYFSIAEKTSTVGDRGQYVGKFKALSEGKLPGNITERFADWRMFGAGIVETPRTLVFGHVQPMAREVRTSAHNWYIDFAYSFGLIALLPVVLLIGYTVHLFRHASQGADPELFWLALVVFVLVVIDSNFKVTLRQPYPGIFAYFMWGVLLTRLRATASRRRARV